jgi:hypothetical protein
MERVTGLAVVTGRVSGGLAIRDFDNSNAYRSWAESNPDDARLLPTVKTARGLHRYGSLDEEVFADLGDGGLRADCRHYTVLPPSMHPDGIPYEWQNPLPDLDTPLPWLPSSLTSPRRGLRDTQQTQQTQPTHTHASTEFSQAVHLALASTLPAGPGKRRMRLFDLARKLKAIIPSASPAELRAIVREWHRLALPFV